MSAEVVTVSEAADLLRVDSAYIIALIATGELSHSREGGGDEGLILIPLDDVKGNIRYWTDGARGHRESR